MSYFGIPIRNGLPIGLGSAAGFGIQPFDPSYLFANGEQGVWHDPSDYGTLFQDAAGTTPVTAVEQAVRLMLDKSKGGVGTNGGYAYNLLTYSEDFGNAYWNRVNATISANTSGTTDPLGGNTADKLEETAANNFHYVAPSSSLAVVSGSSYTWSIYAKKAERSWLCIDAFSGTSANCWFDLNNGVTGVTAAGATSTITSVGNGWYRCTVTRNTAGATGGLTAVTSNADGVGSYQGVVGNGIYIWGAQLALATAPSAYQRITSSWLATIPGNHATAPSDPARPILRARYNALTYSEDFGNAVWQVAPGGGNPAITSYTGVGPNGQTGTIYRYTFNSVSAGNLSIAYQNSSVAQTATSAPVYSIWMKRVSGGPQVGLSMQTAGGSPTAGTFVQDVKTITSDWTRQSISGTFPSATGNIGVTIGFDGRIAAQAGLSTITVDVWGAQLLTAADQASTGGRYQRIAAATDYDTNGFLPYLAANGTSTSMSTGSIDFSATDKMSVFAGVTKLSDATSGLATELSASAGANAGSFWIAAPVTNAANYDFRSGGTVSGTVSYTNSAVAAPVTNVFTGIGNISAPARTLRINGAQVGSDTSSQGTGNFGNYPLYLFARNNASLWFNGRIYGLIVRGAQSSAAQISATEAWLNGKTGAY